MSVDLNPNNLNSLYSQVAGGGGNPLQGVGQQQQIMGNMLQLKSQAMELQARAAMGPLAQASVDPETGQIDYGKFAQLISSDPRTAWKAPEVLTAITQRQLTQAQTIKTALESGIDSQKLIGNAVAGLPSSNLKKSDVAAAISEMRSNPAGQTLFPTTAAQMDYIMKLPPEGPQLDAWRKTAILRAAGAGSNMEQAFTKWQSSNTGAFTQFYGTKAGDLTLGPKVPNTTSPDAASLPESIVDETGKTKTGTRGAILGTMSGITPVPPVRPSDLENPSEAAPPSTGSATGGPSGSPSSPTLVTTKLDPVTQATLEARGSTVKPYLDTVTSAANTAEKVIPQINEIREALSHVQTGGGGLARTEMGQLLDAAKRAGAPISKDTIDWMSNGNLADSQRARKMFLQLATGLMTEDLKGGGRFTNNEFEAYNKNIPNLDTDPRAVSDMLGFFSKMANLSIIKRQEYHDWIKANPSDPDGFQPKWEEFLSHHDPTADPGSPQANKGILQVKKK